MEKRIFEIVNKKYQDWLEDYEFYLIDDFCENDYYVIEERAENCEFIIKIPLWTEEDFEYELRYFVLEEILNRKITIITEEEEELFEKIEDILYYNSIEYNFYKELARRLNDRIEKFAEEIAEKYNYNLYRKGKWLILEKN